MDSTTVTKQLKLQHWTQIFRERQGSGLTIAQWCKENRVTPSNYYYWLKRVKQATCDSLPISNSSSCQIVPVTSVAQTVPLVPKENADYAVRISSGEMTFEFTNEASPTLVEATLKVLTYVR